MELTLDTGRVSGKMKRHVYINSNDPLNGMLRLSVTATVVPKKK